MAYEFHHAMHVQIEPNQLYEQLCKDPHGTMHRGAVYDIFCRPADRREDLYDGHRLCSMQENYPDIVVQGPLHTASAHIYIAALFDVEDEIEAFWRKRVYDKIFNYTNIHRLHRWSPGKQGSAFREGTPFITISPEFMGDAAGQFQNAYRYLQVIDGPLFRQCVETTRTTLEPLEMALISTIK